MRADPRGTSKEDDGSLDRDYHASQNILARAGTALRDLWREGLYSS